MNFDQLVKSTNFETNPTGEFVEWLKDLELVFKTYEAQIEPNESGLN